MRWDPCGSFTAYAVPAALLAVAFLIKLPLLRRAWQDPILRATTLLLAIGAVVFASLPPANLHRINQLTGVPNFAGLWVYSLLAAYCGACLWLIITWREPPSAVRRRRTRTVWLVYGAIVLGLWTTFLLGDHHVERLRDLDTYYADTPWMREFVLLYLVAHLASALVAAGILWAWFKEVEDTWLRRAVVCLQIAYALGLLFDIAKLAAIGARFGGRDWDWLSTYAAPPFAIGEAVLVAVGFIAGQAGPVVEERRRLVRTHRRLKPLWQAMLTVTAPAAPATGRVSGAALRLELRRATINDGLLKLSPHLSQSRRDRTHHAATAAGYSDTAARGIAAAVDILTAREALRLPGLERPGLRATPNGEADPTPPTGPVPSGPVPSGRGPVGRGWAEPGPGGLAERVSVGGGEALGAGPSATGCVGAAAGCRTGAGGEGDAGAPPEGPAEEVAGCLAEPVAGGGLERAPGGGGELAAGGALGPVPGAPGEPAAGGGPERVPRAVGEPRPGAGGEPGSGAGGEPGAGGPAEPVRVGRAGPLGAGCARSAAVAEPLAAGRAAPMPGPGPHPATVDRVAPVRGLADVSDGELECIARALRVHSSMVDTFRREAVVREGLTTHA
ncbi:MAB_1171c family putative transporter [Streptomyces collinus]|uniref:MAB_1171c family putative transporter n=1 Tax=Streptomyces collinus TaxID=42684 RepID=UPI00382E9AA3